MTLGGRGRCDFEASDSGAAQSWNSDILWIAGSEPMRPEQFTYTVVARCISSLHIATIEAAEASFTCNMEPENTVGREKIDPVIDNSRR